jgi:hypothetical protein
MSWTSLRAGPEGRPLRAPAIQAESKAYLFGYSELSSDIRDGSLKPSKVAGFR